MTSPRRYDGTDGPRVAIAHDYLTQRGGAEKVVLSMSRAFPEAPIYTTLYEPDATYPEFADRDVRVSWLNKMGPLRRNHRAALPILPLAANSMHVDADVMLTSTSGWAHGFHTTGRKLIFCHTPAHWLYTRDEYLGGGAGGLAKRGLLLATTPYLKPWDQRAAQSCDKYLAVSTSIRQRIADAYGIAAEVVHSPVAMSAADPTESVAAVKPWADDPEGFYLCVSRLLPYKNVDAVVGAFANTPRRLVVVGRGPEAERLQRMATGNVMMLSDLSDAQMAWLYASCRALVAASHEDYGLTPIEAGVWGKPSVVLRGGGFVDTVVDGVTGVFFAEPQARSIAGALDRFEAQSQVGAFDPAAIRRHVEQFSEQHFAEKLYAAIEELTSP